MIIKISYIPFIVPVGFRALRRQKNVKTGPKSLLAKTQPRQGKPGIL